MKISRIILGSGLIFLVSFHLSCEKSKKCETYDCRRQNFNIFLDPSNIELGETTRLEVVRTEKILPHFRVYIGEYDDQFELPIGVEPRYFEDTDSTANLYLLPETPGVKKIRGIIEEYVRIGSDSIDSYRYPFEIILTVKDTSDLIAY